MSATRATVEERDNPVKHSDITLRIGRPFSYPSLTLRFITLTQNTRLSEHLPVVRIRPTTSPENDGGARRADYNDSQPPYTTSTSYSHDARSPSSPTLQNFQDSSLLRSRPQSSTSLSGGGAGSGFTAGGGSGLPQTTPAAVPSQPFFQQRQSSTSSSSAAPVDSSAAFAAPPSPTLTRLNDFFEQPWVRTGIPEILYIKRSKRLSDRWSSQVAFPGGRQEPEDENALYTALRETWEEVGIDLAEKNQFLEIGQLDDREITTSLGKRLLMVLSPFGEWEHF